MSSNLQERYYPHDWSESGLQLLTIFQQKIKQEGGHFALWSKMRKELRPVLQKATPARKAKRSPYKHPHARFIIDNWKTLSIAEIAQKTNMSNAGVSRLGKSLRLKTKPSVYKGWRKECIKTLVLDTYTGIFYESLNHCARALGVKERTFQCWIANHRKNWQRWLIIR